MGGGYFTNKKVKAFTLIELLAVIVILAIISLIAVPIILGIIEDAREASFKESLNSTFHAFEIYEANNNFNEITEKVSVKNKNFPLKSNFKTGVVYRNEFGEIEVDYLSDGVYCAAGIKDKLSMVKGKCDILDKTEAIVDVKVNKVTTNSITVIVIAEDAESGIEGIYYKIGDNDYKKGPNKYTFEGLEENKDYTVSVKVVNGNKVETTITKSVRTEEIAVPTYDISSKDKWAREKTVTINYPSGEYTYEYSIDTGNTWLPATNPQEVKYTSNGTLLTKIIYGSNEKKYNVLTIGQIDSTNPVIEKIEGNTDEWSRSKTIIVTGSDTDTEIKEYSFDNGSTWQSSNKKEITSNGTYKIFVKDLVGNISEETEDTVITISKIDATSPIVTLGDEQIFARQSNAVTFTNINTTNITNVSCNNDAIPSVSGIELTVSNVTKDTTCSLNETLNNAVNNADTSKNNIVMLSDETLSSGITIVEDKDIKLDLNSKTITNNSSDVAITLNGKLNVKGTNGTIEGTGDNIKTLGRSYLEIDGGVYTSETGNVINNTSGTVNIKGGTFEAKAYTIYNNSTNDINISGGKFLSNDNVIHNNSTGNINITDTDAKVYISSNLTADGAPWAHVTVFNRSGKLNIKGNIADKCGEEENTTGICIYNNYGRTIASANNTEATGIINIKGAYLVSPYQAVANHYGTINICSGKIEGGSYSLGTVSDDAAGYIYYKSDVILSGSISGGSHTVLDDSITCD